MIESDVRRLKVSNCPTTINCQDGFWEMMFLFVLLLQSLKVTVSERTSVKMFFSQ